jgi:uncharacterized membrane protein YkoI
MFHSCDSYFIFSLIIILQQVKKIFSLLLLYACTAAATYAQGIKAPDAITKAFAAKFPGATEVKWGKESAKEYEAEFKLNNTTVSANFNTDGSWTETETKIPVPDLPSPVSAAITGKYPGAVIAIAEKVEKPGKVYYEVQLKTSGKKKEAELTADGKFMK